MVLKEGDIEEIVAEINHKYNLKLDNLCYKMFLSIF